jgi:hypothetical protein
MAPAEPSRSDTGEKDMDHAAFLKSHKNGMCKVYVNRSKALRAVGEGYLPRRYQYAHIFWSWVWFLSFPAGIAIMIFQKWWVGLIFLIFVPGAISAAVKKTAFEFVVEHAEENAAFYDFAVANGIITIE